MANPEILWRSIRGLAHNRRDGYFLLKYRTTLSQTLLDWPKSERNEELETEEKDYNESESEILLVTKIP